MRDETKDDMRILALVLHPSPISQSEVISHFSILIFQFPFLIL